MDDLHCPACGAAFTAVYETCPRDGTPLACSADPVIGLVLNATYRVTHLLGQGALGRVYHAEHVRLRRAYAVKLPRGMWADDETLRARLTTEALAAGRLSHPNLAGVVDHGETPHGLPFLVMELADGESLGDRLERGPLTVEEALAITRQLAAGLSHAHARGVVHRDLKPDNVILDGERARIVDFGIAVLRELGTRGRVTAEGTIIGTPAYMAPEQIRGEPVDARTDLYALGSLLFEMLTGEPPFVGSALAAVHAKLGSDAPTVRARAPELAIDPRVEALCGALLARDPAHRPRSAAGVVEAIDHLVRSGQMVRAAPGTPRRWPGYVLAPSERRRWPRATTGLAR